MVHRCTWFHSGAKGKNEYNINEYCMVKHQVVDLLGVNKMSVLTC